MTHKHTHTQDNELFRKLVSDNDFRVSLEKDFLLSSLTFYCALKMKRELMKIDA